MKLSTTCPFVLLLSAILFGCLDTTTHVPPAPTLGKEVSSCTGRHGVFISSGEMVEGRADHTATILADGRVLLAGGYDSAYYEEGAVSNTSEIYNPSDHSFQEAGKMTYYRSEAAASRLHDGRVLITGGFDQGRSVGTGAIPRVPINSAEIFDPATKTFSAASPMLKPRYAHSSVALQNEKVLVAGGSCQSENFMELAQGGACAPELYDTATGKFSLADSTGADHGQEDAIALENGKVLLFCYQSVAEIYDPGKGRFGATGPMSKPMVACSATVLQNGRVLILGIPKSFFDQHTTPYREAQIYDPASGQFSLLPSPSLELNWPVTAAIDGDKAIVSGTVNPDYDNLLSSMIFDSTNSQFSIIGSQHPERRDFTATTLSDGTVLIAGGSGGSLPYADKRATLFCP